jgi:hypothetical protein
MAAKQDTRVQDVNGFKPVKASEYEEKKTDSKKK